MLNDKKNEMENELNEKKAIYRVLLLIAYAEQPVSKEIQDFLKFTAEQHLDLSPVECDNALKMNEDEAEKILRNLSISRKKALFVSASKITMIDTAKNYSGDILAVLKSKRLMLFMELQKKYDIPTFQF